MTDTIRPSLRDLKLSAATIRIVDELSALDQLLPSAPDELTRYAALLERLPSILDLRGRVIVHASEYQRFLGLAENDPSALEDRADTANALAVLSHAGEIAMLLLPVATQEDRFAHGLLSRERSQQYRTGSGVHDPKPMRRALRPVLPRGSRRLVIGSTVPSGMREVARRFAGEVMSQEGDDDGCSPMAHHLEQALALEAWFDSPPYLSALLNEALELFARVQAWSNDTDLPASRHGARRAALILGYARLCRIGLWPARTTADLGAKREAVRLIGERGDDPDAMRALAEIALGVGRRISCQGPPFLAERDGVEL